MKEDIKNLWVKAARSGEFQQRGYALYRNNKYCIMGVLAMLAMLEGICDYSENSSGEGLFDDEVAKLPQSVVDWAELKSDSGIIKGEFVTLQGYNDTFGYDFEQLADIIETHWQDM